MTAQDSEAPLRARLRAALDPIVPGAAAHERVSRAVSDMLRRTDQRVRHLGGPRRAFGAMLVAAAVVLILGGALGLSLTLRNRASTSGPGPAGHPPVPAPTATSTVSPTPYVATGNPEPAMCDGNALAALFTDVHGAAGTQGGDIALRNAGSVPCTLDGYANLDGYSDGRLTQLGVTHSVGGTLLNNNNGTLPRQQLVTLQPGQKAYVAVEFSVVPDQMNTSQCPTFSALAVTPPDGSHATLVSGSFMLCGGHGARIWIDEAPVSATAYFAITP